MTRIKKKIMTKADKRLILTLVVLALSLFGLARLVVQTPLPQQQVIVKVSGEVVKTIPLQESTVGQSFSIEGKKGLARIEVKGQAVRMSEAPCPDQICVKQGWLRSPGHSIICVPNEIVIYIEAEAPVDGVTR